MAQKISQMTEQSTASMTEAGTADFLGGYTSTGGNANRKFSLSGLANYFLNKFKMTLGGSSQTVKSAIDALNSKSYSLSGGTVLSNNADLNNLRTVGNYYSYNTITIVNGPVSEFSGILKVEHSAGQNDDYLRQTLIMFNSKHGVYTRICSGTNWTPWELIPQRSEVDNLTANVNRTKFLVISSGNHNTIRISGVTYGATAAIPCFIGTKFGIMNVSRSGSVMNVPTFYGTDKPTNTITKAQDSDGTFHFDISVDTWTSCTFIWRRDSATVDTNVSISAIDT